jgi:D-alanyl-D-alanine carboxypeptidase/D-alanyl-D-alanine-endopeptidase (penicillin-binding protein 4)
MVLRSILLVCALLVCVQVRAAKPLTGAELRHALDQVIDSHPAGRRTTVTLKVLDLEAGKVLYDRGGDRLLTPASNLKIYTSACALDAFGPEHRFTTTVRAMGQIRDGVLHGDLVLIGGGDAMLTSRDLSNIARKAVDRWRLRQIAGEVEVDNSRYASPLKGPGWMWDDDPEYYNMSVTPLMVDFNVLKVRLKPEDDGVLAELMPPAEYPAIRGVERDADAAEARVTRKPFTHDLLVVDGEIGEAEQSLTMHDPGRWAAAMLKQMLLDRGVTFVEPPTPAGIIGKDPPPQEITHQGPTLAATLKHFNHKSENAVGEILLHEIAIADGCKRPAWSDGAKAISRWLIDEAGLEDGSFRLVDGSGLSRYNLISVDSSVRLLQYLHGSLHFETFNASLPTSQVNGEPAVHAKGGSMTSVSTISGYIKTDAGRLLAFSLLANGFIGDNGPIMDLRQKVWRELVRYAPE